MPIIKSAIKKVRKDKVRTIRNTRSENAFKKAIKETRKNPSAKTLNTVFSALDKAVKVNIIHRNKAARLKSNLSKLLSPK